jgi:hypothetical protein
MDIRRKKIGWISSVHVGARLNGRFRMDVILAENVVGWGVAFLLFCVCIAVSVLALAASGPALQNRRRLTLGLIAPAFILGMLIVAWDLITFVSENKFDPEAFIGLFWPWVLLAGPPLVPSLLVGLVLNKHRHQK